MRIATNLDLICLTDAALVDRLRAAGTLKDRAVLELVERFEEQGQRLDAMVCAELDKWEATPLTSSPAAESIRSRAEAVDELAGLPAEFPR